MENTYNKPMQINESHIRKIVESTLFEVLKENFSPEAQKVANFIIQNWIGDINDTTSTSEVQNMIQDAYIEVFGKEMDYSNKMLFREIMFILTNYMMNKR